MRVTEEMVKADDLLRAAMLARALGDTPEGAEGRRCVLAAIQFFTAGFQPIRSESSK